MEFDPNSETMSSTGKTSSPLQNPLKNLPRAIREYFKSRRIWQVTGDHFVLNDEFSRQVRRDTLRFRITEKHRIDI